MNSSIFQDAWSYISGPQWRGVSVYLCLYIAAALGCGVLVLLHARRAREWAVVFALMVLGSAVVLQIPAQCQRWREQVGIQEINPFWAPEDRFAWFVSRHLPLPDRCLLISEDKSLYLRYKLYPYTQLSMNEKNPDCLVIFWEPNALSHVPADFKVKAQYNGTSLIAVKRPI